jgi:hypothetical protein
MLCQSYQSLKNSFSKKGKLPMAKYVNVTMMFNAHLAPSKETYEEYAAAGKTNEAWEVYKPQFLNKVLSDPIAFKKLDKLILDSLTQDIVLICVEGEEKYGDHCHRFLLLIAEDRAKEKGIPLEIQRENYLS